MNPMGGMKGKIREQRKWVKIARNISGPVKAAFPRILLTRGPCSDMKSEILAKNVTFSLFFIKGFFDAIRVSYFHCRRFFKGR
jgi:hypothetical protein